MNKTITVEVVVNTDMDKVWKAWTLPEHIVNWMHASDDWECPKAENDLRVGGKFSSIFAAKDKSQSFDLNGVYTAVDLHTRIAYTMEGGRKIEVTFSLVEGGVKIVENFEMENENPEEMQRAGWQAILENFKKYTENL